MPKLLNKCPKMPCARFSPVGRVYMFRIHLHDRIVADSIYTAPMDDPTVAIDNGFVLLTQHDPSLSTSFWLLLSGLTTPKQNKRRLNENRSLLLSRTDTTRLCWRKVPLCLPGRFISNILPLCTLWKFDVSMFVSLHLLFNVLCHSYTLLSYRSHFVLKIALPISSRHKLVNPTHSLFSKSTCSSLSLSASFFPFSFHLDKA